MRVLALHADVVVFISRVWQTTATAVRAGEEGFLIDSPVYPDELEAVPAVLEQAGFPVSGVLATHGDWDHLLGRLAFPEASLGLAESTAARLQAQPGQAQGDLRRFDEEHYVHRAGPLGLSGAQTLPVPGHLAIGADRELELHPAPGHTGDGVAIVVPWTGVLICGDYLSPVEIPMIGDSGGSLEAYRETLGRLGTLLDRVKHVIAGHGGVLTATKARALLDEDLDYLEALERDHEGAALPSARRTAQQRRIHAANVARVAR